MNTEQQFIKLMRQKRKACNLTQKQPAQCDPVEKTCCKVMKEHANGYCYQCHLPCARFNFASQLWEEEFENLFYVPEAKGHCEYIPKNKIRNFIKTLLHATDQKARSAENMYPRCNLQCKWCQNQLNPKN